jgi:hypothetical protein
MLMYIYNNAILWRRVHGEIIVNKGTDKDAAGRTERFD